MSLIQFLVVGDGFQLFCEICGNPLDKGVVGRHELTDLLMAGVSIVGFCCDNVGADKAHLFFDQDDGVSLVVIGDTKFAVNFPLEAIEGRFKGNLYQEVNGELFERLCALRDDCGGSGGQ